MTRFVTAVAAAWVATAVAVGLAFRALAPDAGPLVAALVATALLAAGSAVLAARDAASRRLLAAGPRSWRGTGWLVLAAALALFPLAGGLAVPAAGTLALLTAGYALTGFAEEAVWRGVVLERMRAAGVWRAVLVSAAVFGALHLGNLVYRDSAALVVLQVWGAFCHGVGYAAIRLRTGALWPLMVTHAVSDLVPHVAGLSGLPVYVTQDAVLLLAGLWLTRSLARSGPGGGRRTAPRAGVPGDLAAQGLR